MVEADPKLPSRFIDPEYYTGDPAAGAKWQSADELSNQSGYRGKVASSRASIDWLDAAGPEERASLKWAYSKASAIGAYSSHTGGPRKSDNLIVSLFLKAKDELGGQTGAPSFIAAVDLWKSQNPGKQSPSWVF